MSPRGKITVTDPEKLRKRFSEDTLARLEARWSQIKLMLDEDTKLDEIGRKFGWSTMTISRFVRYKGYVSPNKSDGYNKGERDMSEQPQYKPGSYWDGKKMVQPGDPDFNPRAVFQAAAGGANVAPEEKHVYTHTKGADLTLPDLGLKFGDTFDPEVFHPYEVKNLGEIYSDEELAKSKTFKMAVRDGVLKPGRHATSMPEKDLHGNTVWAPSETINQQLEPLARLSRANPDGEFTDPNNLLDGKTEYDRKLLALEKQDGGYVGVAPDERANLRR